MGSFGLCVIKSKVSASKNEIVIIVGKKETSMAEY